MSINLSTTVKYMTQLLWCIRVLVAEMNAEGTLLRRNIHKNAMWVQALPSRYYFFMTRLLLTIVSAAGPNDRRNDDDLMIWNLISFRGKLSIFPLHNHYAVLRGNSCLISFGRMNKMLGVGVVMTSRSSCFREGRCARECSKIFVTQPKDQLRH